jgi:hypothetical protein
MPDLALSEDGEITRLFLGLGSLFLFLFLHLHQKKKKKKEVMFMFGRKPMADITDVCV